MNKTASQIAEEVIEKVSSAGDILKTLAVMGGIGSIPLIIPAIAAANSKPGHRLISAGHNLVQGLPGGLIGGSLGLAGGALAGHPAHGFLGGYLGGTLATQARALHRKLSR